MTIVLKLNVQCAQRFWQRAGISNFSRLKIIPAALIGIREEEYIYLFYLHLIGVVYLVFTMYLVNAKLRCKLPDAELILRWARAGNMSVRMNYLSPGQASSITHTHFDTSHIKT